MDLWLVLVDIATGKEVATTTLPAPTGPDGKANEFGPLVFSQTGDVFAVGVSLNETTSVQVWNASNGTLAMKAECDTWQLSPDGRRLGTRGNGKRSFTSTAPILWNTSSGEPVVEKVADATGKDR